MFRITIIFQLLCCSLLAQEKTVGVISLDAQFAFEGYTLYAPLSSTDTYLINNCGQVINKWISEYTPGVAAYLDDEANLWRAGVNRDDNEFQHPGTGGYFQKFSWEGDLLWEGKVQGAHHDFLVMPSGNLMVTVWEKLDSVFLVMNGYRGSEIGEFWAEAVYEISPIGSDDYEVVWEWHTKDHLVQSVDPSALNYSSETSPRRIDVNFPGNDGEDWLHFNGIDYDPVSDQVILSMRNWDELWVIDHSTTSAEALSSEGGKYGYGGDLLFRWGNEGTYLTDGVRHLDGQHNPRFLDGLISVYDNGRISGESRPLIIEPLLDINNQYLLEDTFEATVDSTYYFLRNDLELDSPILSSFEILPNGNALLCAGRETRIYEVDSGGNVVWQYNGTVSLLGPIEQGDSIVGPTFNVSKYHVDDMRFQNLNVSVKELSIELNPLNADCELSNNEYIAPYEKEAEFYHFSDGYLWKNDSHENNTLVRDVRVFSNAGAEISIEKTESSIDLRFLPAGFYFYTVEFDNRIVAQPFVKI